MDKVRHHFRLWQSITHLLFGVLPDNGSMNNKTNAGAGDLHMCAPVGSADIAKRLDLRPNTVAVYKTRDMLPGPRWYVSGFPTWCWEHDIMPLLVGGRFSSKSEN